MEAKIKKIADLENVLGKKLARNLLAEVKHGGGWKRLPNSVVLTKVKPQVTPLDDYGTVHVYGANLTTGEITGHHFAGSYDTIINHASVTLTEGQRAPKDHAMLIARSYWNGRNHSWELTVVSDHLVDQVGAKQAQAQIGVL